MVGEMGKRFVGDPWRVDIIRLGSGKKIERYLILMIIYLNTKLSDLSTMEPVTFSTKYMMEVTFITFFPSQPSSPCLLLEVCTDE